MLSTLLHCLRKRSHAEIRTTQNNSMIRCSVTLRNAPCDLKLHKYCGVRTNQRLQACRDEFGSGKGHSTNMGVNKARKTPATGCLDVGGVAGCIYIYIYIILFRCLEGPLC